MTHANAYAERFVRSIKESCLDQMIFFGEGSLRKGIHEFVLPYPGARNHQGLGNRWIVPHELKLGNVEQCCVASVGAACGTTTIASRREISVLASTRSRPPKVRALHIRSSTSILSFGSGLMTMLYCRAFLIAAIDCQRPKSRFHAVRDSAEGPFCFRPIWASTVPGYGGPLWIPA